MSTSTDRPPPRSQRNRPRHKRRRDSRHTAGGWRAVPRRSHRRVPFGAVLVFQDGHGKKLLDFQSVGGITSWIPLSLVVVLFGLAMDYHVFILSRVREAVDRGIFTETAVSHGIKTTASVVRSATAHGGRPRLRRRARRLRHRSRARPL